MFEQLTLFVFMVFLMEENKLEQFGLQASLVMNRAH